jgi:hypothetical protein
MDAKRLEEFSCKNNNHVLSFWWRRVPQQKLPLRLIAQPCDKDEEKDDQYFLFFQVL